MLDYHFVNVVYMLYNVVRNENVCLNVEDWGYLGISV